MGAAAFWQKIILATRAEMRALKRWFAAWIVRVKRGIVEIAVAKSLQSLGREEEKE